MRLRRSFASSSYSYINRCRSSYSSHLPSTYAKLGALLSFSSNVRQLNIAFVRHPFEQFAFSFVEGLVVSSVCDRDFASFVSVANTLQVRFDSPYRPIFDRFEQLLIYHRKTGIDVI